MAYRYVVEKIIDVCYDRITTPEHHRNIVIIRMDERGHIIGYKPMNGFNTNLCDYLQKRGINCNNAKNKLERARSTNQVLVYVIIDNRICCGLVNPPAI